MKVLIAGGGTGGHVYPLVPIAKEFVNNGHSVFFVGRKNSIEEKIVSSYGFPLRYVSAYQFNANFIDILKFIFYSIRGFFDGIYILRHERPDLILGGGGYVSLPVILSAILLRIPIFLYEQNIIPGRTNQIFSRFAKAIFLGFPDKNGYFKEKAVFTGNPVRKEVLLKPKDEALKFFDLKDKFTLLIFGGSGGALKLNETVSSIIPSLLKEDIQVVFITGSRFYGEFKDKIVDEKLRVYPYLNEMWHAYAIASLAITRGGASTLAELVLNNVYSIVVPFPYARDNHQLENARYFESLGCVEVIEEKTLNPDELFNKILYFKNNPRIINTGCSYPNDAEVKIVKEILRYMNG